MKWAWADDRDERLYAAAERHFAAEVKARMRMIHEHLRLRRLQPDEERQLSPKKPVASDFTATKKTTMRRDAKVQGSVDGEVAFR